MFQTRECVWVTSVVFVTEIMAIYLLLNYTIFTREKKYHILKRKILTSSFIFVKVKWIRTGVKGARTHFNSLQNIVSPAPCFSPLNFIQFSISVNQLPFINVEMWLTCKDLLFLYAILHTGTVIFSIMWFAVTTGKNIEAQGGIFKGTKGRVVSSSHRC